MNGVLDTISSKVRLTFEDRPSEEARVRAKNLILYIASKCKDEDMFGATMLNKILWAADFESYKKRGKSVTGSQYQRIKLGPTLDSMRPILDEMTQNGEIEISDGPRNRSRVIARVDCDQSLFDKDDISFVDSSINFLIGKTARQVSDWSHSFRSWKTLNHRSKIPYESVLLDDEAPTEEDILQTAKLENKYGWLK